MICSLKTIASSLAAVALMSTAASAATSWTTSSGSSDTITYSNGQTENGLFTDDSPTVGSNTFLFFPTAFTAEATSTGTPVSNTTSDTLSFIVSAKPGQTLDRISAGIRGDWAQSLGSSVDAAGTLKITNLATSEVLQQNLVVTPATSLAQDGDFEGFVSIDVPNTWLSAAVSLAGSVTASTITGGTSFIQLKGGDVNVQTAAVPLPGAVAIAPLAFAVAWFARRRMAH